MQKHSVRPEDFFGLIFFIFPLIRAVNVEGHKDECLAVLRLFIPVYTKIIPDRMFSSTEPVSHSLSLCAPGPLSLKKLVLNLWYAFLSGLQEGGQYLSLRDCFCNLGNAFGVLPGRT